MRLHSDKRSEELKFYIQSSLTVRKLSARPEDIEDALLEEDTESLAMEPHSFNLLSIPVTRELLRAEEKTRARDLARQEAAQAQAVDSAESDTEPTVNTARGEERRRVYGGMKPSKPNVRDPGKPGMVTNRPDQVRADSKQIFRRSQIEKQRASTVGREGNIGEAAGAVSLPTNPIPASDLDLPPPLTIRSPPPKNPPVSGLNPLLQGLQPIPQAAPRPVAASPTKPGQVPGKPDLVSIQVPMAGADGTQTMQTINIPRSVLAGASDRPILLTVTPKNGINKGQKQIVVLTRNSATGQTSCHVRPPPGVPGTGGRTIISSSAESPTKSVQLSPRPNAPQSQPANNSVIKRHPVVTNSRVVAQPQQKVQQATTAPVQQQQGQRSVVKGQIIQTSRGPVLVQGNRQILLGKNAIQNGKICINQAQIAALTGVQAAQPQAAQPQAARVVSSGVRPGQTTTRSVITGAQLQNMVASGQRIVSMGTNAGGQQVVRVINSPGQPAVQQPTQNGQAQASPAPQPGQGSTASLSRILSALHNRGLVSQQPNGKFYYVGDKTKSPVGISPGSAVKLATSQGIAISAGSSVPGISRLNPPSVQQQVAPVIQQQKSTAAVAVAPAANLDSFMADSDMMMMATSMINSNGTAAAESTPQPSDGETFYYRDRSLPPGWWIKVNKKQVAEYQYQVENFFYSPEGAELKNHENIPAYIAGQLSVDSIGHAPPVSVASMPWKEELSELDKQLVPALDNLVTHQAVAGGIIKRSAGDPGGIDKRFKPDNNVLLA